MNKFRWRPAVAVFVAYCAGIGLSVLSARADLPFWATLAIAFVALWPLYALAED